MQSVIQALASDGGLKRILHLVKQDFQLGHVDAQKELLPFFNVISFPKVLSSGLLETSRDTIYNTIYGPGGRHALGLFDFIASIAHAFTVGELEPTMAVFAKILELNGSAGLIDGFKHIFETLSAAVDAVEDDRGDLTIINVRKWLERAKSRLGLSKPVVELSNVSKKSSRPRARFEFEIDPPGRLSKRGPRHDNDSEDIRDIQVLPTFEEIMSDRCPYLPVLDPAELHLRGQEGLIDRHFRLYREDVVGGIRDAVKSELDKSFSAQSNGTRTIAYPNLAFEYLHCHHVHGLLITVSLDQPKQLAEFTRKQREDWWETRRRLQKDSMVCILDPGTKHSIFCSVSQIRGKIALAQDNGEEELKDSPAIKFQDLGSDPQRAIITVTLAETKDIPRIMDYFSNRESSWNLTLLEFPKVLLEAFRPTLTALQGMITEGNLPFEDLLASSQSETEVADIPPPSYAQQRDFKYDLSCLVEGGHEALSLNLKDEFETKELVNRSTLDKKQTEALIHALSRQFALCQGPPGTGKSYTGVALTRVLLANKKAANLGPILVVCYTNHALDQILEHFIDGGIKRVIRMGGRSKSERLSDLNLRVVSQIKERTRAEKKEYFDRTKTLKADAAYVNQVIQDLRRSNESDNIKNYLQDNYPDYHQQFWGVDASDFTVYSFSSDYIIRTWMRGNIDLPGVVSTARTVKELLEAEINVWEMSRSERHTIFAFWMEECQQSRIQRFLSALDEYRKTKNSHDSVKQEIDLRCLEEANIIGVTTSGLARNLSLLKRLSTKVLLVEEAGEVLEAHILTALLPSVEHAILIGDHQQLRPQLTNFDLSSESPRGRKYSLDISLFERLVCPPKGVSSIKLPFSTLDTQRRMHPMISALIRRTLYPTLEDALGVTVYPVVAGMKKRLFWLDHSWPEAGAETDEMAATSKSNDHEVEMTACLVAHLLAQGKYQSQEIAVLTPYLGQLFKLRARLSNQYEIILDDRDVEAMEKAGMGEEDLGLPSVKEVQKASLLRTLKVATVDNFQGEEAKIVIVSLVRSNRENRCGFLRTTNRINVLLSRAMHGMYIIGNSRTSGGVPMWANVINILKEDDNIGTSLALCCPRHPWTPIKVSAPDDFQRFSPEGGCDLRCDRPLYCGHVCVLKCHSDLRHDNVQCLEPCGRSKRGCDHPCRKHCGDKCDQRCEEILQDVNLVLSCGHVIKDLKCWEHQAKHPIKCMVTVERAVPKCEHTVSVHCYEDVTAQAFKCKATCQGTLGCGHNCVLQCYVCNRQNGEEHGKCMQKCDRPYSNCSHKCSVRCHPDHPCGICRRPCEVACSHSRCDLLCGEPCVPCSKKDCSSSCPHGKCSMPCAAPCDKLPCSQRCPKILPCGHQCPSLCGENCPDKRYCQACGSDSMKSMIVDPVKKTPFSEANLDKDPLVVPRCGHANLMSFMDSKLNLSSVYELHPDGTVQGLKAVIPFSLGTSEEQSGCPKCAGTLRGLNRYGRLVRHLLLDESVKRFVKSAGSAFGSLTEQFYGAQKQLETLQAMPTDINPSSELVLQDGRDAQFQAISAITSGWARYEDLKKARRNIANYTAKVHQEETPFAHLWKLVEAARRKSGDTEAMKLQSSVCQVSIHVMTMALLIRCDVSLLADVLNEFAKFRKDPLGFKIQTDLAKNRNDCLWLMIEARKAKDYERAAEAHIFYARYCAMERSFATSPSLAKNLKTDGESHTVAAHKLCELHGGKLKSLADEIKSVERMLTNGSFKQDIASKDRLSLVAAMAEDFRRIGHGKWFTCDNDHPFTVVDDKSMELARCPQCDASVGGQDPNSIVAVS
ncbi:P-loop containing nucleoside triphosphate hydrolase protein [Pleomassaria siparia CBS 279.74]|uniref:P-loop containing nucleoside triphosphate hydrolase protein n=1 Tax=Pleomassaria siparia CBS 279.74 TaxID=1314801 RepID=A0A6G1KM29_9PLEO|nr:P-loop containing nucleoside triphosphate hydrolase protein [Pleomassaria siparia CBS 279.74]